MVCSEQIKGGGDHEQAVIAPKQEKQEQEQAVIAPKQEKQEEEPFSPTTRDSLAKELLPFLESKHSKKIKDSLSKSPNKQLKPQK